MFTRLQGCRLDFSCVRLDFSLNVKIGEPSLVQADNSARWGDSLITERRPCLRRYRSRALILSSLEQKSVARDLNCRNLMS